MRILLDTCEFLWLISGANQLAPEVAAAVKDTRNEVFLSSVSFWEIALKHSLGKLSLPKPPAEYIPYQRSLHRISSLPLDETAVARLTELPALHRDPFDRMLICQAQAHGLTLASSDPAIRKYPVTLL